ncbi:aldose 1-epimerase family protein [Bradyrhizobium liaoningense]|uniref:aldose 1-epimerase family protein n=1 Tax=Bradyrhizobium liaoningense TaxID=43992 RepID=UPI001BA9B586|nr:aldose 1-epimerase family protein [Bradyrhizobium liaoningense]MBR0717277.1 aldose 1-epimerase family protein [Bradyrhizobium liaoningense]
MREDTHVLRSSSLTAIVTSDGAELCSLRNDAGTEFIWQAGPAWPRHAPLLFPIVGRLKNDELRHRGQAYRMTQHGFARDVRFAWLERSATRCVLVLHDGDATRANYPFAFRLAVTYSLDERGLDVAFEIANTGEEMLPASLGGHPAFNWPLVPDRPKDGYALTFPQAEASPVRCLEGGLLRASTESSPIDGRVLRLSESLFAGDAIIFDRIASQSVHYAAAQGPWVEMSWTGFRELGVWSKPTGAPFLCIEPWRGYASPWTFDGEFCDKPGLMQIAPGTNERLAYRIAAGTGLPR